MRHSKFMICGLVILLSSCSGSGGGDEASIDTNNTPGSNTEPGATKCGLINNGELVNPPVYTDAPTATLIRVIDSNLVQISVNGSEKLVKLQGLGATTGFNNTAAENLYAQLSLKTLHYFPAGDCTAETASGIAEVGQIVTADGQSFGEEALDEHIAGVIETSDNCNVSALAGCYSLISDPSAASSSSEGSSSSSSTVDTKQVGDFLWKPDSESGYNPGGVTILLNPCDVNVFVNGQQIREYPTGNGRCTTVRSGSSGCSYGTNIKVEILEKETGNPVYFGSQPYLMIDNGCDRTEFEGVGSAGGSSSEEVAYACDTMPGTVSYSPQSEQCGGNAAVTLSGDFAGAFSVQLRLPDGGDRLDEGCALASCSPYKVQNYIDGSGTKTACFGAPGNANLMVPIVHTSIKMAGDDSDPDRFCIPDASTPVN
ncbi:MAG: hypothetical protein IT292_08830 [Deltaproteobacteria bacterium]|nr:hypothetical protein [Deltaproteobacteria bacterium]